MWRNRNFNTGIVISWRLDHSYFHDKQGRKADWQWRVFSNRSFQNDYFWLLTSLFCGTEALLIWKNTYSLALLTKTNYKMIFISKLSLLIDSSYSVFCITIDGFVANLSKTLVFSFFSQDLHVDKDFWRLDDKK